MSLSADDIRDEKVKVLRSLQVVEKSDVVIGQHTAANGIPGYLEDEGVPDDSPTPTFAAMCLHIANDRSALLPPISTLAPFSAMKYLLLLWSSTLISITHLLARISWNPGSCLGRSQNHSLLVCAAWLLLGCPAST